MKRSDMKEKNVRFLTRITTGLLSASLILPMAGCTGKVQETPPSAEAEATPTLVPTQAEPTPEPAPSKIDDNGKPIADFDEFVNGEWLREQAADSSQTTSATWETGERIEDRVRDIFENTDISALPGDDALAKIITYYREAIQIQDMEERVKTIREYLKPIESVKSLNDLYKLSAREEYSIYESTARFLVKNDDNGYNREVFMPYNDTKKIKLAQEVISGEGDPVEREALLAYWKELGYSEERLSEILDNALKVSEAIDDYYSKTDYTWGLKYWDQDRLDNKGLNVPVIDILRELNAYGRNEEFLAPEEMIDLLNTLYTAENVKMLKDMFLYSAGMELYTLSAYKAGMTGADEDLENYVLTTLQFLRTMAGDILAEEYRNRYLEDGMYENAEILADEIKNELMAVLSEADWMGENSKRALKAKIARMSYFLGSNGYVNKYPDLELSGNFIDDLFSFKIDYKRFMRTMAKYEDDKRLPFQLDMMDDNGTYLRMSNTFVLCTGTMTSQSLKNDAPYEERLARAGMIMAHEMSHTLTPDAIYNDEQGYYNEQLSEAEADILWDRAGEIAAFFDGKEITDGKSINGWQIENEAFADLLALRVCLNILAKTDDPDYDLFFRCFAERRAQYVSEDDVDVVLSDSHLPGKLRINYILGQFDIFYEIYDIDESSTYYVPEDKRLKTY